MHEKIFSFGGYCTGDDYKLKRPMDVHVLNTGIFIMIVPLKIIRHSNLCLSTTVNYRWNAVKTPDTSSSQYYLIPYQRYGHTAVVQNDLVWFIYIIINCYIDFYLLLHCI